MENLDQKRKAKTFRELHSGTAPVLLVNVWDVASARIIETAGFPALATTSAGIAFSLGYPDGQKIAQQAMFSAVARIARAVNVPVSADVEAGYGARPEDAAKTASEVIAAGAVGLNFEDATGNANQPLMDMLEQIDRIHAIREVASEHDVPIVLNARTDVYLLQVGDPAKRYDEALRRLCAYRDAGADCVFVPGMRDAEMIGRLVADLKFPVNILGGPGLPSVGELVALGVRRISLGSCGMRAALGLLQRIAHEFKGQGTYTTLEDSPSLTDMNTLMSQSMTTES